MRYRLVVLLMLLCPVTSVPAQVSIGIGLPSLSIGINLPLFPELVPVPGYPVYYAPRLNSNYFFYDGMYWVYQGDDWYASSWYNGPWGRVGREVVPLFVLRIPVLYYRQPPVYFSGWQRDAPPRWGEHWGRDWEQRRSGWDRWDRNAAPAAAALPVYQRNYSGDRYPRVEQQQTLHNQNYRYQPQNQVVREHYQQQKTRAVSAPAERVIQGEPRQQNSRPEATQRSQPEATQRSRPEATQRSQPPAPPAQGGRDVSRQAGRDVSRSGPPQGQERGAQGKGAPRESNRSEAQDHEKDRDKGDERRPDRNR
jgi:hypothetical protein